MSLHDRLVAARASGDFAPLLAEIPYARFLGLGCRVEGESVVGTLRYSDRNVGNLSLPALHGGTVGALLEWTSIFQVLWQQGSVLLPKTITFTVDFLRPGRPVDTQARATVTRQGRRVVNVRAEAWQDDPARPIALASALFLVKPDAAP